jgi:hypothetical protein
MSEVVEGRRFFQGHLRSYEGHTPIRPNSTIFRNNKGLTITMASTDLTRELGVLLLGYQFKIKIKNNQ